MIPRKKQLIFITITLLFLLALAGCSKQRSPVAAPTCADALSGRLSTMNGYALETILDKAWDERRPRQCWTPLMKQCLDQNVDVPHRHLARAVNEFNRFKDKDYFHKAIFRYFSSVEAGNLSYSAAHKNLLTAYCRYVIHHAASQRDPYVRNAELLTGRLDPELYELMFKY